jgi:hypothetical protein
MFATYPDSQRNASVELGTRRIIKNAGLNRVPWSVQEQQDERGARWPCCSVRGRPQRRLLRAPVRRTNARAGAPSWHGGVRCHYGPLPR